MFDMRECHPCRDGRPLDPPLSADHQDTVPPVQSMAQVIHGIINIIPSSPITNNTSTSCCILPTIHTLQSETIEQLKPSKADSEDISSRLSSETSFSSSSSYSESSSSDNFNNVSPEYLNSLLKRTKDALEKSSAAETSWNGSRHPPQPENDAMDNLQVVSLIPWEDGEAF